MSRWFILRTSGAQTLPLARSLREAGFDVWTPARTIRRVIGQGSRKGARLIELEAPILPTFVFARETQLLALAAVAGAEISPHPAFSVFRHSGRIPLVGDAEVRGLQEEEERAAATIRAMRQAESRAEAEAIRVAALREEAERAGRHATWNAVASTSYAPRGARSRPRPRSVSPACWPWRE